MARLVANLDDIACTRVRQAADKVSEFVDGDFRKHCRLCLGAANRLRINVDHPGLVYSMRARWLPLLKRALTDDFSRDSIRDVEFAYGTDGTALPGAATTVSGITARRRANVT